jgi:hypothetical protein
MTLLRSIDVPIGISREPSLSPAIMAPTTNKQSVRANEPTTHTSPSTHHTSPLKACNKKNKSQVRGVVHNERHTKLLTELHALKAGTFHSTSWTAWTTFWGLRTQFWHADAGLSWRGHFVMTVHLHQLSGTVMNHLSILLPEPEQPEQPDHWSDQISDQLNQDTVLGSQMVTIGFPTSRFPIPPLHSITPSFTLH